MACDNCDCAKCKAVRNIIQPILNYCCDCKRTGFLQHQCYCSCHNIPVDYNRITCTPNVDAVSDLRVLSEGG